MYEKFKEDLEKTSSQHEEFYIKESYIHAIDVMIDYHKSKAGLSLKGAEGKATEEIAISNSHIKVINKLLEQRKLIENYEA